MKMKARKAAETIPDRQWLSVSSRRLPRQGQKRLHFSESKGTGRNQTKIERGFIRVFCLFSWLQCMYAPPTNLSDKISHGILLPPKQNTIHFYVKIAGEHSQRSVFGSVGREIRNRGKKRKLRRSLLSPVHSPNINSITSFWCYS